MEVAELPVKVVVKMEFILWTLVWWGLAIAGEAVNYWGYGGAKNYNARYSKDTQAIAGLIYFVLWIVLYNKFVKGR